MKSVKQRIFSAMIVLALALSLVPVANAATYDYAVQGGNLKFDPSTGAITDCDQSVTIAEIPNEIYGVPVTEIGKSAFSGCSKLVKVTIPSSAKSIGADAFINCSQLRTVSIPDGVTSLPSYVFSGCTNLETISIPGSVKRIGRSAFSGCKKLREVTIGEGLEVIEMCAFSGCTGLTEITLPDSLKVLSEGSKSNINGYDGSFNKCSSLTKVTIGKSINYISDRAFAGCSALSSIYFRGNAPGTGKDIVTGFANGFTIYYPQGASGWTTPTWNGYITKSYQLDPPKPVTPPPSGLVTAVPTSSKVYVNGTAVAFDAYNIKNNNYFKLRDLAFVLSGSKAQFEVSWDGAANAIRLTSGQPYTPVGGEMSSKGSINKVGKPTNSALYLDGKQVNFTAYNIDSNNYFKLRDIGQALNFSVEWNGATNSIEINTSLPYRSE